ncbi:hypothetical protein AB7714_09190 [Tardiphaga sp. 1201_B9_N1_1]|jgi:hypothetical protein|uniref:hypothetical protein n=1 Tax=Tardiphaga TaxID=1395974 RepID=UPI0011C49C34|nr:hypothetical protein [Tardiphaga robiniae]NUU39568.1 hypothetical protein [Tardiphaga robiniae]
MTIEKQRGGSLVASRQALPHRCLPTATKQQHFWIYSFSGGAKWLLVQCSHELDRVFSVQIPTPGCGNLVATLRSVEGANVGIDRARIEHRQQI